METPHSRVTLRQLELFCAAADHGSFAAAAESLYLTPNAVAFAVNDLETALGTHLCVRHRARGLSLTPAGKGLLRSARSLLRDADELVRVVGSRPGVLEGPVTVGCYSTIAATVLPPLLEGFRLAHPNIQLDFVDGPMSELVPRLEAGEIDLAITYRVNLPSSVNQTLLYSTDAHILLAADHPLARADTLSLDDLANDRLILLDVPPSGEHTIDTLTRAGVTPNIIHRTTNFELVRSLVARGVGYSLLIQKPKIDVSYEGRRLIARRPAPHLPAESVVIIWPKSMRLTDRARALIDFAAKTVPSEQWLLGP